MTTATSGMTLTGLTLTDPTSPTGEIFCPLVDSFEPNNAAEDASIVEDGEIDAAVCPFDIDFYSFSITKATYLSAVVHFARNDGLMIVTLFGPEMQVLRVSSGKQGVPAYTNSAVEAIHEKLRSNGTYLISVAHLSGDTIPYRVELSRFVDETP